MTDNEKIIIPAGTIVVFTDTWGWNRELVGVYRAVKDIDAPAEVTGWLRRHQHTKLAVLDSDVFLTEAVQAGLFVPVEHLVWDTNDVAEEIRIGDQTIPLKGC